MPWPLEVLIVSTDRYTQLRLTEMVAKEGLSAVSCTTLGDAQTILLRHQICLVFSDCRFADGDIHGILAAVENSAGSVPVIVIRRPGDWEQYVNALVSGAHDYIECSWPPPQLQRIVRYALSTVSVFEVGPSAKLRHELGEDL